MTFVEYNNTFRFNVNDINTHGNVTNTASS
jgi:hypothetical protein